ncbi:tail tube GTA-gp10-like protein, partial [Cereibacter changlensis]
MTTTIRHHAYFGTMNFVFALTDPMIAELERLTDTGIGAIYQRVVAGAFSMIDLP